MEPKVECFFLRPSTFAQASLRRFTFEGCSRGVWHGHNAAIPIGVEPYPFSDLDGEPGRDIGHDDPRWPTTCECGYVFKPEDEWQHNLVRLYFRSDHLAMRTTLGEAPVGSMYYADWYDWKGPDGHCLVVQTPAGPWIVDGPSRNNDGTQGFPWTRTGDVPKVTVTPSINFPGKFHGWLRNGVLESC